MACLSVIYVMFLLIDVLLSLVWPLPFASTWQLCTGVKNKFLFALGIMLGRFVFRLFGQTNVDYSNDEYLVIQQANQS